MILFVTVVLVRMFVLSARRSEYASKLTDAVKISENMAELASGAGGREQMIRILEGLDQVSSVTEQGKDIVVFLSGESSGTEGLYRAVISWDENDTDADGLVCNDIAVYETKGMQELYRLSTAFSAGGVYE